MFGLAGIRLSRGPYTVHTRPTADKYICISKISPQRKSKLVPLDDILFIKHIVYDIVNKTDHDCPTLFYLYSIVARISIKREIHLLV